MESDRQSSRLWPFLIGFFAPLVPAIIGLLFLPDTSSGAKKFVFLLTITPLVAIGFLIYEYTSNKRVMMYGTLLVFLLGVSFEVWFNLFAFSGW